MATKKLTAAQKRDRDFMRLLDDALKKQAHELALEYAGRENDVYGLGLEHGEQRAEYEFSRLTLWQRITWKPQA